MLSNNISYLTGKLLNWPRGPVDRDDLLHCERLRFVGIIGNTRWEELRYVSPKALYGEDPNADIGTYEYTVVCRRSGARLLLLSEHSDIVEYILERELKDIFSPRLRTVDIAIDRLVKSITERPTIYVLSYAHARVPGFGANLRSATFYGEDLGAATLFSEMLGELTFTNCGLRLAAKGKEIVRLGTDGAVSFVPANKLRLESVERILSFLRTDGYLHDFGQSETADSKVKPNG